jgi:cell pole-organizing protein PopZ
MSSTERAPEPTMEDILASIRRIITDDDADKGQGDKPTAAAQAEDAGLEGEADNQIIDDIARVLSSGSDEPANEDEEIMDLTGELGGLELVEEESKELLETADLVDAAPEFVESSDVSEELVELETQQPDVLQPDQPRVNDAEPDVLEPEMLEVAETAVEVEAVEVAEFVEPVEMEAPQEETVAREMPSMVPPPIPEPQAEVAPEAPKLSASEEAATALERAIAALKAGQSPATAAAAAPSAPPAPKFGVSKPVAASPEPAIEAEPTAEIEAEETPVEGMPFPTDIPMAVPMESLTPDDETHLDPDVESVLEMAEPELEPEALAEDELVLMDDETGETMALEEEEPAPETESAPFWPPQDFAMGEAQPALAKDISAASLEVATETVSAAPAEVATEAFSAVTNGLASYDTSGPKSLEDSIKEMLRPMLREWLDENMPRMIREELDSDALQRERN